jgi:hypothetical protein
MESNEVVSEFVKLNFAGMNASDVIEQSTPLFSKCVQLLSSEWNQIQELKKTQLFEDYGIQTQQIQIEEQYSTFVTLIKDCIKKDIALKIMAQSLESAEVAYVNKIHKLSEKLNEYNQYMMYSNEPELHIPHELTSDIIIEDNPFFQREENKTSELQQKPKKRRRKQTEMSFDRTADYYTDIELKIWLFYFVVSPSSDS